MGNGYKSRRLTSNDEPIGWVRSTYFMLSPFALKTSGGVGRKALVVPNLDSQTAINRKREPNYITILTCPARMLKRAGVQDCFACSTCSKKQIRPCFWGSPLTVEDGSAGSVILGWMPKQYLTEWNRRVAYGPAYGEFAEAPIGEKIPFFMNQSSLSSYKSYLPTT